MPVHILTNTQDDFIHIANISIFHDVLHKYTVIAMDMLVY